MTPIKTRPMGAAVREWAESQVASTKFECCLQSPSYYPVPCQQLQLQNGRNKDRRLKTMGENLSKLWLTKSVDEIHMTAEQWLQKVLCELQRAVGPEEWRILWAMKEQWFTWELQAEVGGDEGSQCTPDLGQPSCFPHPPPKLIRFAISPRRGIYSLS